MPRHLFVVFLSVYAELTFAVASDWNCEKNEAGEWSCETQPSSGQLKKQLPAQQKTVQQAPKKRHITKSLPEPEVVIIQPAEQLESKKEPVVKTLPVVEDSVIEVDSEPVPITPIEAKPQKVAVEKKPAAIIQPAVKTQKETLQNESMAITPKTQSVQNATPVSLYSEESTGQDGWNCEKNAAGEWSCMTQTPTRQAQKSQPAVAKPTRTARTTKKSLPLSTEITQQPIAPLESTPALTAALPTVKADSTPVPVISTSAKKRKALSPNQPVEIPTILVAQNPLPISLTPPSDVASTQEGWSCTPNDENSTWDCLLSGVNPKGETRLMPNEEHPLQLLPRAFDAKQERIFKTLQKSFPFDPWQQCSAPGQPKQKLVPKKGLRETSPLEIEADYAEVFDNQNSSYTGNVDIRRADQHLVADMASYDTVSNMMDTQGNVYYNEDGLALFSNTATLKMATDKSVLRNVLFESLTGPYRGSAAVAYKDSKELSHYKEASYTSCEPGNQDWVMHTSRLKLNKDIGEGSATNTWLEFKGVPLFYTPYISFPIDDRRKTGFLPPSFGNTSKSGFQLTTPYYWNIAPNYDVLFKPRYYQNRGALLAAEMRYLNEIPLGDTVIKTKGAVNLEYMPYDSIRKTSRFFGSLKNNTVFLPNLTANADLNYLSDTALLYDLGGALNINNNGSYIRSNANVNYTLPGLSFLAQVNRYQTIDSTLPPTSRPYQQLPQLLLNLNHSFESMPIDLNMSNEYTYFYRANTVTGQRFNTRPSVTFPLKNAWGFATPKLSLQYTQYLLQNQTPALANSMNRIVPTASLDTGLFLERELEIGDNSFRHTLEPRAFYLYAPRVNQDNIPIFDTGLYDFTFASLFRENRFSGNDRVQDANQLSLALTSRLLDSKTGMEYAKLNMGQILYFKDRNVIVPGYTPETNRYSTFVTELSGSLDEHFSYSAGLQWDPYTHQFTRGSARLQYNNQGQQVINVGYLYRQSTLIQNPILLTTTTLQDQIDQTDVSFRLPIYDGWSAMGRWLYAIQAKSTVDSFIGFEKDTCCWRFSIIGRRFSNNLTTAYTGGTSVTTLNTANGTTPIPLQTGIFVQFELKGLGSFGDQIDQFLAKNIPGYRRTPY